MKLRNWLKSSKEEQASEPVEVGGLELDSEGEVLKSGHNLQQLKEDIEGREDAISELERDVDRHERKKKRAVDKARKAEKSGDQSDKKGYMVEAKEHKEAKAKKEKILDHLRNEKLVLKKLQLQHLQNNVGDGIATDLDIDLGELDASAIEDAIEDGSDELWESAENMEDINEAMEMADSGMASLDLSDIEKEVNGTANSEGGELLDRSLETEEEIDQAIEEELEKIEGMHSDER
ncbi:hypothetical protein [Haloarcula litorea]|uniref:hypothetical protein n=1 Tax=Haloarcula litorea TaxID=3032579 RepID=UPI0023E7FBB8|nr:hypothetical protein [Halomicroarcula sp. GDY20]